jgi:hypothetical protein
MQEPRLGKSRVAFAMRNDPLPVDETEAGRGREALQILPVKVSGRSRIPWITS